MDYRMHQRRLLPLIARSYAYRFAQNQLVARMHRLQTSDVPDAQQSRELEGRAAGLKAAQTWHATTAIQEAREACGGAGYLAENRLTTLKGDTDVFTDMQLIGRFFKVDVMFAAIGGHFTMDPERAAQAVEWVNPKAVVPIHWGTYPILSGNPARLRAALEPRRMSDRVAEMKPGETRGF